jgi:hypothetical protein
MSTNSPTLFEEDEITPVNKSVQLTTIGMSKPIDNETLERINRTTSTVLELRSGIFAPIGKITTGSIIYKDYINNNKVRRLRFSGGIIDIKHGVLTMTHKALLNAFFAGKASIIKNDGEVELCFAIKDIQPFYNGTIKLKWLKEKLDEMRAITIHIILSDRKKEEESSDLNFSIISTYTYSADTKEFRVSLNNKYSKIFDTNLTLNFNKHVKEISMLKYPFAQAIVMFFLTQEDCQYSLIKLIEIFGYGSTERAYKNAIEDMNKTEKEFLLYGIEWNSKKRIFIYTKNKNISIYHPPKPKVTLNAEIVNKEDPLVNSLSKEGKQSYLDLMNFKGKRIKVESELFLISDIAVKTTDLIIIYSINKDLEEIELEYNCSIEVLIKTLEECLHTAKTKQSKVTFEDIMAYIGR